MMDYFVTAASLAPNQKSTDDIGSRKGAFSAVDKVSIEIHLLGI